MKIRLNRKFLREGDSGIIQLRVDPIRAAYVPKDEGNIEFGERGLPEYILVYNSGIPGREHEPELYDVPHGDLAKGPDELWLQYQLATVILIGEKEDDRFRQENPEWIKRIESLYVEL